MRHNRRLTGSGLVMICGLLLCILGNGRFSGEPTANVAGGLSPIIEVPIPSEAPTPTPLPTIMPTATPLPTPTPSPAALPTPAHIGEAQSLLNGVWLPEETARLRPYGIMINNIEYADPQRGLSRASVLYEALTEAGITRFLALYEGAAAAEASEEIGSVRSARHYFVSFALEHDAIFVHFGGTTYAEKAIKRLKADHIDGIGGRGQWAFFRDNAVSSPHNVFLSLFDIHTAAEQMELRLTYQDEYAPPYTFTEEPIAALSPYEASSLQICYSSYITAEFTYQPETGLYARAQFGKPHLDAQTNEPLTFATVLVRFVEEKDIDKNGYQTMTLSNASGEGLLFSGGQVAPITWRRVEKDGFMQYYDAAGEPLVLCPGRLYIGVCPDTRTDKVTWQ